MLLFCSIFFFNLHSSELIFRAYYHEFALLDHDKVKLVILSKMSKSDLKEYEEFKSNYLKKNSFITDSNLLPEIQFISKKISYLKLPRLYMSRVALIGTSHGEGWGLPLTEAMCMGVITIATNWSGNLEFMNDNNSLLVSVEKLVDANTEGIYFN